MLGRKALYNTHVSSNNLNFNKWVEDARCRALDAAKRLKKKAKRYNIKASVKIGS